MRRMSIMEIVKVKNKGIQFNQKEKIKKVLDEMLDFLAEMPVDKYHDYREFKNLRLRQYLIHNFMRKKYVYEVTRTRNTKTRST